MLIFPFKHYLLSFHIYCVWHKEGRNMKILNSSFQLKRFYIWKAKERYNSLPF